MKKLLPLAVICLTLTSVFAEDVGRRDRQDNRSGDRGSRACELKAEMLKKDNQELFDKLLSCQNSHDERDTIDRLNRENQELVVRNQSQMEQIEHLKIDNARLEMEAHPDRGGRFNLAESIMACSKIANASLAQQCSTLAKTNSVEASVIAQCTRITNAFYALECVRSVGGKEIGARQVEACLGIQNASLAQQCVQVAAEKRVSSDIITSCIKTSSNAFYQLECVKSM